MLLPKTVGARGTINYMAPENGNEKHPQFGRPPSDMFSNRMMLYEMGTGCMPWKDDHIMQVRAHRLVTQFVPLQTFPFRCVWFGLVWFGLVFALGFSCFAHTLTCMLDCHGATARATALRRAVARGAAASARSD